ncbi:hypothetical protein AMATHDRAFT_53784 [Amanita thiersii Skay4041]|uniref:Prenyltransferase alpha-alpha toroid domain-containing protein n=1 Tax=Amanita thiersii Skay4041 TaxID=703135 RepID=A0A2A9NZF4_9AGAR|nr:hypothetical protein AMATHDRAFT_53784 [Amanita thiersii Skay4041]
MEDRLDDLPALFKDSHSAHCKRCLMGLPSSSTDLDASRLVVIFYCINALDLLGLLSEKTTKADREAWRDWIWRRHTFGVYGSGFKPSSYMSIEHPSESYKGYDTPHLIMTYTALLSLAVLRDDFSKLDRKGLINFLRSCQKEDGSFSTIPNGGETDLRTLYCAFVISMMLDDWSGIDIPRAISFIKKCRTHEGGYGQFPLCEAHGGTTYIAVASLYLVPNELKAIPEIMSALEREETIRWLIQNQEPSGGFRGRTGKEADACYCFWCGAALQILGAKDLVNVTGLARFLGRCQFKYGGFSKAPGEHAGTYKLHPTVLLVPFISYG